MSKRSIFHTFSHFLRVFVTWRIRSRHSNHKIFFVNICFMTVAVLALLLFVSASNAAYINSPVLDELRASTAVVPAFAGNFSIAAALGLPSLTVNVPGTVSVFSRDTSIVLSLQWQTFLSGTPYVDPEFGTSVFFFVNASGDWLGEPLMAAGSTRTNVLLIPGANGGIFTFSLLEKQASPLKSLFWSNSSGAYASNFNSDANFLSWETEEIPGSGECSSCFLGSSMSLLALNPPIMIASCAGNVDRTFYHRSSDSSHNPWCRRAACAFSIADSNYSLLELPPFCISESEYQNLALSFETGPLTTANEVGVDPAAVMTICSSDLGTVTSPPVFKRARIQGVSFSQTGIPSPGFTYRIAQNFTGSCIASVDMAWYPGDGNGTSFWVIASVMRDSEKIVLFLCLQNFSMCGNILLDSETTVLHSDEHLKVSSYLDENWIGGPPVAVQISRDNFEPSDALQHFDLTISFIGVSGGISVLIGRLTPLSQDYREGINTPAQPCVFHPIQSHSLCSPSYSVYSLASPRSLVLRNYSRTLLRISSLGLLLSEMPGRISMVWTSLQSSGWLRLQSLQSLSAWPKIKFNWLECLRALPKRKLL